MTALSDVTPHYSTAYFRYCRCGDWKHSGDLHVSFPGFFNTSDGEYVSVCKLGHPGGFSSRMVSAPLLFLVDHIVSVCSDEKVRWIAATAVIAVMTYVKAIWYRAICQFPCHPVTEVQSSISVNPAMARFHFIAKPGPAGVLAAGFIYSAPELFCKGWKIKSAKAPPSGAVHFAHGTACWCLSAFWNRAMYFGLSHVDPLSRSGQRRRSVETGRRLAIMAHSLGGM